MAFLHGIETIELSAGVRPVTVVRAAVVGLIGIAPKGPLNTPTLVTNDINAAQFGKQIPGFTIPQALDAIFKQGAGTVIVVNVFDADTMTATVTAEESTVANGKYTLAFAPIGTSITVTNSAGDTTYVNGTHYTFDDWGVVTILDTATIPNGTALKTTYERLDATQVTNADIIGTVGVDNSRTGLKAFANSFSLFGFEPVIFAAPKYVETNAIAVELISTAEAFKGFALIDAPVGTTLAQAIAGRGQAGTINFNTASKNAILLFPHVNAVNARTGQTEALPFSQFFAGVWCKTIAQLGVQFSPSNKTINGIVGLEQPISFNPASSTTDANLLNENGIVTVGNGFGTGFLVWGNRSASYPTSTAPDNFFAVLITAYIIDRSIEQATLQFVDQPLLAATIDSIRETVNAFLRSLIARGALVDGACTFNAAKNPPEQLAAGQIVFDVAFMPPTPAERITYDRFIDISLLTALTAE